jgi:arginine/lysine/ornithine decarboxylase
LSAPDPQSIVKKLEELASVSKDLDANMKMLSKAANIVAAEQLKKRYTELTETLNRMMHELVALHPSKEQKDEYLQLSRAVEELPAQIKACKDIELLRELEKAIEEKTGAQIHCFQTIVAELMGGKPPAEPVFD